MGINGINGLLGRLMGGSSQAQAQADAARQRQEQGVIDMRPAVPAGVDIDRVELSSQAPKPVEAATFEQARSVGARIAVDGGLSTQELRHLRQDRVFTAMAALTALAERTGDESPAWPGGLPAPSRSELEEAYRRIRQRLVGVDQVKNADALAQHRERLIDRFRSADFGAIATSYESPALPLAA